MKKRMNLARRRMSLVISELNHVLLLAGGREIELRLTREDSGLRLRVQGDFAQDHLHEIERMSTLLQPAVRDPALVETYWELAGGNQYTGDSELALVGQMLDTSEVVVEGNQVRMNLYLAF